MITELDSIKESFDYWAERMTKLTLKGDLTAAAQYLSDVIHLSYYNILLAMFTVREKHINQSIASKNNEKKVKSYPNLFGRQEG